MGGTDKLEEPATEITITVDGRVFFFGLSAATLEIAASLDPNNHCIEARLDRFRKLSAVARARGTVNGAPR